MVFPPPPTSSIDWSNIGFKVREVNGHIESHYSVHTGTWTTPTFVSSPFLSLHGLAPALNYGQQCYEGLKAFRSPDDKSINIFRPSLNARRMQHSASFIAMPAPPEPLFLAAVNMAVALNAEFVPPHATGASMYIRPLLFGSCAQLGLNPPDEYTFVVYVLPVGVYHGVHPVDCLILETFDRAAPNGTGSAKVGGNYAPVLVHSEAARKEGYGITLHLDSQRRTTIDEFSTSGFLGIKKEGEKTTLVVPDSNSVINSVTSRSIQEIAASWGWSVEVRPVPLTELSTFTEVMAAGTAAALVPIKSITMKSTNMKIDYCGDEPGEGVLALLKTLKGVQTGNLPDTFGWLEKVVE
ncbi:branched-chain amino acid aminotransferase II, partial [Morchella conica CCBAS932]